MWKEPRCPSTDDWIKKMWSIYTMEYYSGIRKNEFSTFAMTRMELEGNMLSEISQAKKDNYHMVSLIWNIRSRKTFRRRKGRRRGGKQKAE